MKIDHGFTMNRNLLLFVYLVKKRQLHSKKESRLIVCLLQMLVLY